MFAPYDDLPDSTKRWLGIAGIATLVIVWGIVCSLGIIPPFKLPAPWSVVSAFASLVSSGSLVSATLWSASRVLIATALTVSFGLPVGVAMGASPRINAVLAPILDPLKSSPTPAFLPLLIMWLGIGEPTKIVFLFISSVVYLAPMVRDAILAVPKHHWTTARDLGATELECVRLTLLPLALPRIWDAVAVVFSIAWTYIPIAEFIAGDSPGLGTLIQTAQRFSATDQVLAGIFAIIAVALLTNQLMTWGKKKLFSWERLV